MSPAERQFAIQACAAFRLYAQIRFLAENTAADHAQKQQSLQGAQMSGFRR